MARIKFMEYGTNEDLFDETLDHIPAVGDFVIANDKITSNWKKQMYLVMAVTHLLDNGIIIHLDKYDPDERAKKQEEIRQKYEELSSGIKKAEDIINAANN